MGVRKSAIPAITGQTPELQRILQPMKESIEHIIGARAGVPPLKGLQTSGVGYADIVGKVNEIVARLNVTGEAEADTNIEADVAGDGYVVKAGDTMTGNLGIGTDVPAAWASAYKVVQVGGRGAGIAGTAGSEQLFLTSNTYWDGTNLKYGISSQPAAYVDINNGYFTFANAASGTADATATFATRFEINNDGLVAVAKQLNINNTGASTLTGYFTTGASDVNFRVGFRNGTGSSANTEQGAIVFDYVGTGEVAKIGFIRGSSADADGIAFHTNGAERLRILGTAAALKFPATQAASTDANALDDYEEGTWTPGSGTTNVSVTSYGGYYVKIGQLVVAYCYFNATNSTGVTITGFNINSLPFTSTGYGGGSYMYDPSGLEPNMCYVEGGNSYSVVNFKNGIAHTFGASLMLVFTYRTGS